MLCFIVTFMFMYENLSAQNKTAYCKAFKYIKGQYQNKHIIVIDTLAHLDLSGFYQEISLKWGKTTDETIRILDSLDHSQIEFKKKYRGVSHLEIKGTEPTKLVYFSEFYDNMLMVEVMNRKKNGSLNHNKQSTFNQSKQYLFLFNKKRIKKVFVKDVQYN